MGERTVKVWSRSVVSLRGLRRGVRWFVLMSAAVAFALSCGDDDGEPSEPAPAPAPSADASVSDAHGHAGSAAPGVVWQESEVLGVSVGLMHVSGPPMAGESAVELRVERAGEPVSGLAIAVEPWMPGHGHGTPEVPVVDEVSEGRYRVENVVYTMPGAWELRVTIGAGDAEDTVIFAFEVGGETAGMHPEGDLIEAVSEVLGLAFGLRHMASEPVAGDQAARVRVTRDGEGVDGLDLSVEPWMPGHGHGTPVVPAVEALGQGRYAIAPIRYTMPGSWELRVTVREGDAEDTVVFPVVVR